jgi:hypothetical protein
MRELLPRGALLAILLSLVLAMEADGEEIFSIFGNTQSPDVPASVSPADNNVQDRGLVRRQKAPTHTEQTGLAAYCVRTCDGRYFPAPPGDRSSQAQACHDFCPASETKAYFGSSIERASSADGKPYSQLPNAYRYRTELVPSCTCNGANTGLARISIDQDKTMRAGDLIAGDNGLLIAGRGREARDLPFRESMASMKKLRSKSENQ